MVFRIIWKISKATDCHWLTHCHRSGRTLQAEVKVSLPKDKWLVYTFCHRPIRKTLHLATGVTRVIARLFEKYNQKLIQSLYTSYPELYQYEQKDQVVTQLKSDQLHLDYLQKSKLFALPFSYQPKISIVIPVYKVKPSILNETLLSVVTQTYGKWEICLVDDASNDPKITDILNLYAAKFPGQIHVKVNSKNLHISESSNVALKMVTGDYVGFLDHDDLLIPSALAEMVRAINKNNQPDILYSDERVIAEDGSYLHGPFYKPAWSPMLHLSCNYTTHFSVYSKEIIDKTGGFRKGFEGSQDHDLMLRAVELSHKPVVHVPFILYLWRATSGSTALNTEEKPYAAIHGIKAITESLQRRGREALVEWEPFSFHYRIKYKLPAYNPKISIIIPTRDRVDLLKNCLNSIKNKSLYHPYEIIVVNNDSLENSTLEYFAELKEAQKQGEAVRVIDVRGVFNFARLNNEAVKVAAGEYLVLLNNDTLIQAPQWLDEMLSIAQWPEIGAVGCKLLYHDGTLQHAGVVLQDRRIAAHALRGLPSGARDYISMANTIHETAAVTAACLMISKEKYLKVDGLDELYLPNGFGDIDFCLKLLKAGFTNVYTPYAVVTHLESKSRGRTIEHFEKQVMLERWGWDLLNDRYVNPNLNGNEYYIHPHEIDSIDFNRNVLEAYWAEELKELGGLTFSPAFGAFHLSNPDKSCRWCTSLLSRIHR